MTFIRKLFDSNYGLSQGQLRALGSLANSINTQKNKIHASIASSPHPVNGEGVDYMMHGLSEQWGYMDWFIRNNPELIEDDGRIKPQINTGNGLKYVSWKEFESLKVTI